MFCTVQRPALLHCAAVVHAAPSMLQPPARVGQFALLVHAAPLVLHVPESVGQFALPVQRLPCTLHVPVLAH